MPQQPKVPTFEIESGPHIGSATIKIDDQQMDGVISSVGISVNGLGLPKVWLELDVAVIAHLDMVDIKLQKRTTDMLKAMGWTAPPDKEGEKEHE